jgi:hypothetical protein
MASHEQPVDSNADGDAEQHTRWAARPDLSKVQFHELVQKSRHDLRLAEADGVMERLEVNEVGAVDAGSFSEHRVSNRPPATLQRAVLDIICDGWG